jgi:hypothetical protein
MKTRLILALIASLHGAHAQTIESGSHSTTGYVKPDGTIKNSSHSTTGYIRKDGRIENASHSTIGYAKGVPRESAAVVFFFFKFK